MSRRRVAQGGTGVHLVDPPVTTADLPTPHTPHTTLDKHLIQ